MWGKHCIQTKPCKGNTVVIHSIFFYFKKATKLISQPAQYIKKTDKDCLKKKRSQFWVKEMKNKMYKKGNKSEKKHVGKATVF